MMTYLEHADKQLIVELIIFTLMLIVLISILFLMGLSKLTKELNIRKKLAQENTIFALISDHIPLGILIVNQEAAIEYVNIQFQQYIGFVTDELYGLSIGILNAYSQLPDLDVLIEQVRCYRLPLRAPVKLRTKKGHLTEAQIQILPIESDALLREHIICIFSFRDEVLS